MRLTAFAYVLIEYYVIQQQYSTSCYIMYVCLRTFTRHSKLVAAALGAGGFREARQNDGKPNALVH